ncbi:hypothetical protein BGZ65_001515 [Modicella reniformis]|uniref:Uncharacterized protein n=1 Tax=Modicella reniformis TaxID=1440133 RepID=A0A9P6INQ7_9FUNG|nr:hypothetical protein BGZ65_001515 [Modicella reniformis]
MLKRPATPAPDLVGIKNDGKMYMLCVSWTLTIPSSITLHNLQAQPLRKSQRISRSDSRDDSGSSSNSFTEDNTKGSTTGVDDPTTVLKEKLLPQIFSNRPTKYQVRVVEYFVRLSSQPAPTFNTTDYVTFVKKVCPSAPTEGMATAWNRVKSYFDGTKDVDPEVESRMDVASFTTALKETPMVVASDLNAPADTATRKAATPSLCSTSRSRNSSSGGSTANSKLTQDQVLAMRTVFSENFDKFRGGPWSLPSGAVFDEHLRGLIEHLPLESALHSFIIEDVDLILKTFKDATDQEEIKRAMNEGWGLPALSPAEITFLKQYDMPPGDLNKFLKTHAWGNVGEELKDKPSDEFQQVAHDCVTHVLRTYQQNALAFPNAPLESWFTTQLWGFFRLSLSCPCILEYKSGEVPSDASARRRNKQRACDDRQYGGHKADGLVVVSSRSLEICHIEAAKKDGGANATKSLDDTKKLFKLMKDAHDMIREMAVQNVRDQVVTFGLRLSGPTLTVFALRQLSGRFYQAVVEAKVSFPPRWNNGDTSTIIAAISRVLKLRKAILAMSASVSTWTSVEIDGQDPGSHDDCIAPTMTSPQCLPAFPVHSDEIPPLDL